MRRVAVIAAFVCCCASGCLCGNVPDLSDGADAGSSGTTGRATSSGQSASSGSPGSSGGESGGTSGGAATSSGHATGSTSGGGASSGGTGSSGAGPGSSVSGTSGTTGTSSGGASIAGSSSGGSSSGSSTSGGGTSGAASAGGGSSSAGSSGGSSSGGSSSGGGPMVAFLQDGENIDFTTTFHAQFSANLSGPVTAGDLLIVAITYGIETAGVQVSIAVGDSLGNAFTEVSDVFDVPNGQGVRTFVAPDVRGGSSDAVTASFSPSANYDGLYAAEYAGLAPSLPVEDAQATDVPDAGGAAGPVSIGATASSAPALLWAFGFDDGSGQPPGGFGSGAGFVSRGADAGVWQNGNGNYLGRPEDRLVTQAGPQTASWSVALQSAFIETTVVLKVADGG